MIGQVLLKRYKILRLLDEGGMSRVYLGVRLDQPCEVAVKVLRDNLATQPKIREHFRREAYILSSFRHPHAVAFLDADNDAKQPFLVMEYLRGVDLLHLLERNKRLSAERAGRLLGQMCAVLHAAHDAGIVHRDLKPANFMIVHPDTPHEQVKLMDFGLAKMSSMLYISPEELVNLRHPSASGTPEYISPEQIRGNDVDRRSDVYSLGVVLFEMVSGRRPFESLSVDKLLTAHLDNSPPSFASLGVTGVPPAIEAVVRSCLSKYPEDRPQSAEELAQHYEEALGRKVYHKPAAVAPAAPAAPALPTATAMPPATPRPGGLVRPSGLIRGLQERLRSVSAAAAADASDRNAFVRNLSATMPESMAMLKLKGFIHDLGGEIVESVPGLIRVRVLTPEKQRSPGGLRGWFGGRTTAAGPSINMELAMEKPDPSQPSRLTITLRLTSSTGAFSADGRSRCEQIGRDLQAYLMG
jgi:serine/threonine-protein kinase